jgi:hypothetical protein
MQLSLIRNESVFLSKDIFYMVRSFSLLENILLSLRYNTRRILTAINFFLGLKNYLLAIVYYCFDVNLMNATSISRKSKKDKSKSKLFLKISQYGKSSELKSTNGIINNQSP